MSEPAVSQDLSSKRYLVAQWATGKVGARCMRGIIGHPNMDLVGLYVHSEAKAGRDAGELCGMEATGVKATRNIDDIIAASPDCVMYMQEGFDADDVCRLLEAGINVVTTRGEFFYRNYPWAYIGITRIARDVASLPIRVYRESELDGEPVETGALVEILRRPNSIHSLNELVQLRR